MSTMTMGLGARLVGYTDGAWKSAKVLAGRMLDRAIAAREAEARARAAQYLNYMSDQRLMEMGLSAQDIQLMRESGRIPPTIWS